MNPNWSDWPNITFVTSSIRGNKEQRHKQRVTADFTSRNSQDSVVSQPSQTWNDAAENCFSDLWPPGGSRTDRKMSKLR